MDILEGNAYPNRIAYGVFTADAYARVEVGPLRWCVANRP